MVAIRPGPKLDPQTYSLLIQPQVYGFEQDLEAKYGFSQQLEDRCRDRFVSGAFLPQAVGAHVIAHSKFAFNDMV